jgi:hypothetical protein
MKLFNKFNTPPKAEPSIEEINKGNKAVVKFMVVHAFTNEDEFGTLKPFEVLINMETGEIVSKVDDKSKGKITSLGFSVKKVEFRGAALYDPIFEMHKMMTFQPRAIEALRTLKDNFNK